MRWLHEENKLIKIHITKQIQELIQNNQEFQKNGIVVLLDALGTKGIWKDNDPTKILKARKFLTESFKDFITDKEETEHDFSYITFSDTMIITATSESVEDLLLETSSFVATLIAGGMVMDIFLRGGISVGTFYSSKEMIIGPAVDEVAEYHNLPEWIGVSATPTANRILTEMKKNNYPDFDKFFFKYDIPLKNMIEQDGWAVTWPIIDDKTIQDLSKKFRDDGLVYQNFTEIVNKQLEKQTDIRAAMKWRNTLNYHNTSRVKLKELKII